MGCIVVKEQTVVALENFGKFERLLEPGLHLYNPFRYGVRQELSLKVLSTYFKIPTITSESLSVLIHVALQYQIDAVDGELEMKSVIVDSGENINRVASMSREKKLYNAFYSSDNPMRQFEQHIDSYFRIYAAKHSLKEMLLAQDAMSGELMKILNREMQEYGYKILCCMVTDIEPPDEIKQTMNSVLTSENRRQAMINEAEGKKAAAILEAEGQCRVKELEGEGLSLQRKALANGLSDTMREFGAKSEDFNYKEFTATMITQQYMDTLRHAAENGQNSFILTSNPMGAASIEDQIRNGLLSVK